MIVTCKKCGSQNHQWLDKVVDGEQVTECLVCGTQSPEPKPKFKAGDKVWRVSGECLWRQDPIIITECFVDTTGIEPDTAIPRYAFERGLAYPRETDLFSTKKDAEIEVLNRMATRLGYKVVKK